MALVQYLVFFDDDRKLLFNNIADAMQGVPEEIIQRQIVHLHRADPAFDEGVAKAVGVEHNTVDTVEA